MQKYLIKTVCLLLILCFPFVTFAQNKGNISGTVKDVSGQALPGVSVVEVGTTNGTITDFDGNFTLSISGNAEIAFSFVGYKNQTMSVNAGQTGIAVTLEEDTKDIDEVVVVGYGVQKKSDLTGSVASVKGEDLKGLATSDAAAALQGKAAGIQIVNASGKPGQAANIRVRGYSSNSDNIGPLLIVDGLQVSSIQYLDPDLIESMEVLKDAASAAIYGAEAGNGVVLITTKKGAKKKGEGTITYNGKWSLQSLGKVPELLGRNEFIEWHRMLNPLGEDQTTYGIDDAIKAQEALGIPSTTNTNWLKEFMVPTWSQQHSLSMAGGNDRGSVFVNFNYINQDGIVKGNNDVYERLTGQVNADYKIKDWFQVGTNTSIEKWRSKGVSEQGYATAFEMLLLMDPLTPVTWNSADQMIAEMKTQYDNKVYPYSFYKDENGDYYATSHLNQRLSGGSPFVQRERSLEKNDGVNVNSTAYANLTPFKGFVFTSRFGARLAFSNNHNYVEPYYMNSMAHKETYEITAESKNSIYYQWENFANYNKTFAEKHDFGAMVGMSFKQTNTDGTRAFASGQDIMSSYASNYLFVDCVKAEGSNYAEPTSGEPSKTSYTINNKPGVNTAISYFGRLSYSYDNRYSLQFNLRADAFDASKLAKENRWGYFPSVSAGWTLSNESFLKDMNKQALSFLKIRASWGRNGNVNILKDYSYTSAISVNSSWYQLGSTADMNYGSKPSGVANPELTWETSEQVDLGIDARFLNNKLSVGMDYYNKKTKDLLVEAPCLPESGVAKMFLNAGEVKNSGFELEASYRDKIGDVNFTVSGNLATLKNEVTYLAKSIDRIEGAGIGGSNYTKTTTQFEVGHPVWYMYGYKYLGKDEKGEAMFEDLDKNGTIDNKDMQQIGCGMPKLTYGITLSAEYKGIDLTVFGTGAAGNDIYYGMYREGYSNVSRYFYDEAKAGNMPNLANIKGDEKYWSSDAMVFNGSFFKIKQIQLGYTLPSSLTKKAFIQNLRCYVSLDDFFTCTKYIGLDPETCANGGNNIGLDSGAYPTMRKLTFGVNVTF